VRNLHEYLQTNIIANVSPMAEMPDISLLTDNCSLDAILPELKTGYRFLQRSRSKLLADSLDYGKWLNAAYKIFDVMKKGREIKGRWSGWLKNSIGISDSYARQLRELDAKFGKYRRLRCLRLFDV
jgi:hypothetical protein